MASPAEMYLWKVPATRSVRTALPNWEVTAVTLASLAPVKLWSSDTTTWLVAESTYQAVPGMRAEVLRVCTTAVAEAGDAVGWAAWVAGAMSRVPVASVPTATAMAPVRTDMRVNLTTSLLRGMSVPGIARPEFGRLFSLHWRPGGLSGREQGRDHSEIQQV